MKREFPPPGPTPAMGEGARALPPLVVWENKKSPKTSKFLPMSSLLPLATNWLRLVFSISGLPKSVVFSAVALPTAFPAGVALTGRYIPAATILVSAAAPVPYGRLEGSLLTPGEVIAALKPEAPSAIRVEPARTSLPTRPG